MYLATVDWFIILAYFAFSMSIALYFSKRAGASTDEFFLSGRKLPWYVAGTAMVATTFAADTPLAVTELVAQRMMSAKDEKHSLFATLWFIIAHYAIRPWPWIIVALVSLVLYPDLDMARKGDGFIMVIRDLLPPGLLGLMLAAFFAAYMSTIATQLNWGPSYLVNDFYRRFIRPNGEEQDYVRVVTCPH